MIKQHQQHQIEDKKVLSGTSLERSERSERREPKTLSLAFPSRLFPAISFTSQASWQANPRTHDAPEGIKHTRCVLQPSGLSRPGTPHPPYATACEIKVHEKIGQM